MKRAEGLTPRSGSFFQYTVASRLDTVARRLVATGGLTIDGLRFVTTFGLKVPDQDQITNQHKGWEYGDLGQRRLLGSLG